MTTDSTVRDEADVAIIGGGPAGLNAALMLGRGRKRVLLYDSGPPRNAAAVHVHGFLTRDGTPPSELRRIGREQLAPYDVAFRGARVHSLVRLEDGRFRIEADDGASATVRKVLLATGMVDVPPALPGYRALWGHAIFQCPYCHGWEHRGQRWGLLATGPMHLDFGLLLKGWTGDLVVFVDAALEVPEDRARQLERAGVVLERRVVTALRQAPDGEPARPRLEAVELADGTLVPRDVLFAHPPQRQVELVVKLGLALNEGGFVQAGPMGETSIPGIHAAGDLTSHLQGAVFAASMGAAAGAGINHALNAHAAS